jgi:hypothetical protein
VALFAHATTTTGNVKRNRANIANTDELHIAPDFYDFPGYLMTKHETPRRCRPASNHVLIGTADIRGYDFEDDPMRAFSPDIPGMDTRAVAQFELGKVDTENVNAAGLLISHSSITRWHRSPHVVSNQVQGISHWCPASSLTPRIA